MKEIGGFFELELPKSEEYHSNAMRLNTGRNCLEYILRSNNYKKIYIPYYICNSILEPINKLNIEYEQYYMDNEFNINLDFTKLKNEDLILYVNYFGICNKNVEMLLNKKRLHGFDVCIDNTQAFFNMPNTEDHTMYSVRKFFGVEDGAYLYTNAAVNFQMEKEISYDKSTYLLKRIDIGASETYNDFKESSKNHANQPIRKMSNLSKRILQSIDYEYVKNRRLDNFNYLKNELSIYNNLNLEIKDCICPMVYPLLVKNGSELKNKLISNNIFVATYWPGILENIDLESFEAELIQNLIPLPVDQRYDTEDMKYIIDIIEKIKG